MKDPKASFAFYDALLTFMGYRLVHEDVRGYDWDLTTRDGAFSSIGIKRAEGPGAARPHDRYSAGLHHVAWTARDRADVDALYAHLLSIGATILNPPALYPQYGATYYAVFFADYEGLKLEFVHWPSR